MHEFRGSSNFIEQPANRVDFMKALSFHLFGTDGMNLVSDLSLTGEALGANATRAHVTSTRLENAIQSTLNHTSRTQPGMLPRSRTLEDSLADTPGQARNGANPIAGGQAVREEPGFGRGHRGSPRDPASGASCIVFLHGGERFQSPVPPETQQKERRAFHPGLNAGVSSAKIR